MCSAGVYILLAMCVTKIYLIYHDQRYVTVSEVKGMIVYFCLVSAAVGQVQLRLFGVKVHTRLFAHHFGINSLVRLHAHNQLVPLALRIKDVTWHISELQPNLSLALIQGLSTTQDEGNPCFKEE